jgi:hypothetical protein
MGHLTRHLWSLLAGIAAAPLAWLLLATGQHRSQATVDDWESAGLFNTAQLIGPVIVLLLAGVLLGVLGTLRWSPAGPIAAGLLLVLPTVFMFVNPFRTLDAISEPEGWRLLGQDLAPRLPVENGTLLVLGALLLMATFSTHRWRRWPTALEPIPSATDEQVVTGMDEAGDDEAYPEPAAAAPEEPSPEEPSPEEPSPEEPSPEEPSPEEQPPEASGRGTA